MVRYRNRVLVVEHKGRIIHRFRSIAKLQVHNRIEGYLNFYRSASPSGRGFPGYGECVLNLLACLPAEAQASFIKIESDQCRISASWMDKKCPVYSDHSQSDGMIVIMVSIDM